MFFRIYRLQLFKQIILELLSSWLRCILQVAKGTSFMFCQAFQVNDLLAGSCQFTEHSCFSASGITAQYLNAERFFKAPAPYVCMPYNRLSEPAL